MAVLRTVVVVNIIEEKRRLVHVSGHASQGDIKIMVETAKPKFVIPIHGEYRMLFRQKEFIKHRGGNYNDEDIILIENGNVLELDEFAAKVVAKHDMHKTFIDEESMEEIEYDIVRERKKLAYGGAISLVVTVDKKTHTLAGDPQITFQGVAGLDPLGEELDFLRDKEVVLTFDDGPWPLFPADLLSIMIVVARASCRGTARSR